MIIKKKKRDFMRYIFFSFSIWQLSLKKTHSVTNKYLKIKIKFFNDVIVTIQIFLKITSDYFTLANIQINP